MEDSEKDTKRLDFMWERNVTMYKNHPRYSPMCICFTDSNGSRQTIISDSLRAAIDKAIESEKV